MKFFENSGEAANYLRLAVPKMIKHNIVPNPLNYTLWYSYYSNAYPKLNQALDLTIEQFGTCPQVVSEDLFLSHITKFDNVIKVDKIQQALLHVASDLSDNIEQTSQTTANYSNTLIVKLDELSTIVNVGGAQPIIEQLTISAQAICSSNDKFKRQIETARQEIEALKNELKSTKKEATTDHLTGLFNRRVFESIYEEFAQNSNDDVLAVIMMDIDKFKTFNDTHGHNMGDQILKFVGKLLKKECEMPAVPVRFGGEEFIILCPTIEMSKVVELAERIRIKLSSVSFVSNKTGKKISPITASFGIAVWDNDESVTGFIERADKALYCAKDNGRNQVVLAD